MRVIDQAILQRVAENYEKEIPKYIEKLEDKIISRLILPVRPVDEDIEFDVVTEYDRTGAGASFVAKGVAPKGSGVVGEEVPYRLFQALDGYKVHEKDMKVDKQLKNRKQQVVINNMQRFENYVSINGDAATGVPGIATMAALNPNGVVASGDLVGAWDGSGTNRDIYEDLLLADGKLDGDFEARFLVGNKVDINWLKAKNTQEDPFYKNIASLFGKSDKDPMKDWAISVGPKTLAPGKVYMIAHDDEAAEFVVGEDRKVRPIAQQPGGNFPIEVYSWWTIESHDNAAFVEIATS